MITLTHHMLSYIGTMKVWSYNRVESFLSLCVPRREGRGVNRGKEEGKGKEGRKKRRKGGEC